MIRCGGFRDPASENVEEFGRGTLGVRMVCPLGHYFRYPPYRHHHDRKQGQGWRIMLKPQPGELQTFAVIPALPCQNLDDSAC